ncbi:MAG: NAD-dependent epimerase/dehydratase family protein [Bacteroidota bacterium]
MKIIVTGVAGFVGSNLAAALLREGHIVEGIDNFSFGAPRTIEPLRAHPNFHFFEADVRDPATLTAIPGDAVVHLASQKIPRYTNALRTLNDNSRMTANVVDKCVKDGIKMVFASTSDVYGKNPHPPFSEESNLVLGPTTVKRWAYATSKIYSEQYIIANHDEHGLEYTIMRFFGSYGPNQNLTWWGGPQSVFIQNTLEGKMIDLHGDGQQTRTFTFVEDTVQGVMKCIFHPNSRNEIFNIANHPDEEVTIRDLAFLIHELMLGKDTEPNVRFIPYETFGKYEDVRRRVPDISKAMNMLDFNPQYSLREGLKRTIEWQRAINKQIAG